jgi:dolichol-phosphate mannosyltransferase
MSHGWHQLSTLTLGFRAADVDCGIKLFHRRALALLVPRLQGDHATISPEILALAHLARLSVTEVEVEHRPRSHGAPSGARPDVVVKSLKGLVALRKVLNEARVP